MADVKYEEVYLKPYASVLEAQRGLEDYFRFYNGLRPTCSIGSLGLWIGSLERLSEQGVHRNRRPNHWQQSRDSHLVRP